ncbi:hypothetical protein [Virgibacillus halodenitrificans]|uniref:hypothetical protein n=1 Tax=Virgibacillus halodenitrificans TaxID=1482 RepID=UPI000EF4DF27|nr:hypothetical protein [Virgibacillus halodenitrificans]
MDVDQVSNSVNFNVNSFRHFHPSDIKGTSTNKQKQSIKTDIDYHGSSKRKKYGEEKEIQNQITQYQQARHSFEKTSDIVHYLKDLIKNDKEDRLPKFNDLFKEVRNAIDEATEDYKNGNIPQNVGEIILGIVENYFGDSPDDGITNDNNNGNHTPPVNDNKHDTPVDEEGNNPSENNGSDSEVTEDNNGNDNIPTIPNNDDELNGANDNDSTDNGKEGNSSINGNDNSLEDLYEKLVDKIENEITKPIFEMQQHMWDKQNELINKLLDNQKELIKYMQRKTAKEMMLEMKLKMLEDNNRFLVHQYKWEQRRNIINLLM